MWAGTYGLDLYCDNATSGGELVDEHGHNHGEFPHQYTGESGSNCRTRARRAGWIIGRDGSAICPKCSGKRKPSNASGKPTTEAWREDQNKALAALDMEWARKMMPDATSDHVRLMAMHKGRYECTDLDNAARHTSGEWLRQHGYGRMTGEPLLQEGVLPE